MRALPKRFLEIVRRVTTVRVWLDARYQALELRIKTVQPRHNDLPETLMFSTLTGGAVGAMMLLGVIGAMDTWPWAGTVWLGLWLGLMAMGITAAIVLSRVIGRARMHMQTAARVQFEAEERGHPLVQRAELIERAVRDFSFHYDRYQEWRRQVDDELVLEDSAAADRYIVFLERAHAVLERAIVNFNAVAERMAREEQYLAQHPELQRQPDGTALTLLLDDLKADVEKPELPQAILDPMRALEREEQLAAVVAELGQHEATG